MIRRSLPVVLVLALILAVAAVPALAETFTIKLTNGNTFITRYQPRQASWDTSIAMLLTDVGNWIAVPQADIESVVADQERRGFGLRIDSKTIEMGYVANDELQPGDEGYVEPGPEVVARPTWNVNVGIEPGEIGNYGGFSFSPAYTGGGDSSNAGGAPAPQPTPAPPPSAPPSGSGGS